MQYRGQDDNKTIVKDCPACDGSGVIIPNSPHSHGDGYMDTRTEDCVLCGGTGFVEGYQMGHKSEYVKGVFRDRR